MSLFAELIEEAGLSDSPKLPEIVLSDSQQKAYKAYAGLLSKPGPGVLVVKGYAGTGKTTLVDKMVKDTESILRTASLLSKETLPVYEMAVTATTHKAVEALQDHLPDWVNVHTIQSELGLRLIKDPKTGKADLMRFGASVVSNVPTILFIDEASFIDIKLLGFINSICVDYKIVMIGDPCQLTAVNANSCPAFNQGYTTVEMVDVVRQTKGNPIIELATAFREVVKGNEFFQFNPDGFHIQRLSRGDFERKTVEVFSSPNWTEGDSKVLCWTNKKSEEYNENIREAISGNTEFTSGDYAIINSYVDRKGRKALKANQAVRISKINTATCFGVSGYDVKLTGIDEVLFLPKDITARAELEKFLRKEIEQKVIMSAKSNLSPFDLLSHIDATWVDLRAAYSCTINKSQGSTYDSVFIDLDNIKKCRNGQLVARLLYVAVSRARNHVYMTGDLI